MNMSLFNVAGDKAVCQKFGMSTRGHEIFLFKNETKILQEYACLCRNQRSKTWTLDRKLASLVHEHYSNRAICIYSI